MKTEENTSCCPSCGATINTLVCGYCGSLLHPDADEAEQKKALASFHGMIADVSPETQLRLLQCGFIPTSRDVLIDAASRCLAIMGPSNTTVIDAAVVGRLNAIIFKLRTLLGDPVANQAVLELEKSLQQATSKGKSDLQQGMGCLMIILAVFGWILYRAFR